jgi:hypothetical protein
MSVPEITEQLDLIAKTEQERLHGQLHSKKKED